MEDRAVLIFKQDCHKAPHLEPIEVFPKSLRRTGMLVVCEEAGAAEV